MNMEKTTKTSQIKMSFSDYDKMLEKAKKNADFAPTWPDVNLIEEIEENINEDKKWLHFCCFISEYAPEPVTENDKESKKKILELINKYLILEENEET